MKLKISYTSQKRTFQRLRYYLLFFLVCSSFGLYSQSLDSLTILLQAANTPQEKVHWLNEISFAKQPNSGKEEALQALILAKEIKAVEGEAIASAHLGNYYAQEMSIDKSIEYLTHAKTLFEQLDLPVDVADILLELSWVTARQEQYNQSLVYALEAKKIGASQKDSIIIGSALNSLATIYAEGLEKPEKARAYFLEAIRFLENTEISSEIVTCYYETAFFYLDEPNNDSLLLFVKNGKTALAEYNDLALTEYYEPAFEALTGYYYLEKGAPYRAKETLLSTLPYFVKHQHHLELLWHYISLSEIAFIESDFEQTIQYARLAQQYDLGSGFTQDILSLLRDAYKEVNKDSFLIYNEKYIAHIDTLDLLFEANKIHKTIREDLVTQKDSAIIKEKNSKYYLLVVSILLGLILSFALFRYYQKAQRQKAKVKLLAKEKEEIKDIFTGKESELTILKEKITTIERNLMASQLNFERQQSTLNKVTQVLKNTASKEQSLDLKKQLNNLSREVESNLNQEDRWQIFVKQFNQIHPDFFSLLIQQFPTLNNRDLRICAYVRLGLDNQEIANILGIEPRSVIKAKHRTKKKMNLEKAQKLDQFLLQV